MKKIALMTTALALLSGPAFAQNAAALCKLWNTNAAKSVAYQPGVDVNGRAVVPADGGVSMMGRESIRIPVTAELAGQLGAAAPAGTTMDAVVGVVNIGSDGSVNFNGQDLTQATVALCGQPQQHVSAPVVDPDAAYIPPPPPGLASRSGSLGTLPAPSVQPVTYQPAAQVAAPAVAPRPISAQVNPSEPYTPPAVVPAVDDDMKTRPATISAAGSAGGAVHTPAPAPSVTEPTVQDDIIYGEGNN